MYGWSWSSGERHPGSFIWTVGVATPATVAGQIDEVRYRGADVNRLVALVKFGEREDTIFVVTLHMENGKWAFEDINSPSREYFESGSKVRPE